MAVRIVASLFLTACAAGCATTPTASNTAPAQATAPASGKHTKADLEDAQKLSFKLYPAKFDIVFKAVIDQLGQPDKVGDNMNEWYAVDAGKCLSFFMTKSERGLAAVGIYDTEQPNLCRK